jgi:hypothetical protein
MECGRLRVKDVDFGQNQIVAREGKGKDRVTVLPERLKEPLAEHLKRVKLLRQKDLEEGNGRVYLPYTLSQKYPSADREWGWQYVFPAPSKATPKPHPCDLEATLKPPTSQAVGTLKPPASHPHATLMRP